MAVAAGIAAAVVGAAATVGSSAISANAAKKKSKSGTTVSTTDLPSYGKMFNRGTADLLDEQRRVLEDANAAGAFITPELWKALGYDPIYDDRQDGNVKALSDQADAASSAVRDATAKIDSLDQEQRDLRRQLNDPKNPLRGADAQAARARIKAANKEAQHLRHDQPLRLRDSQNAAAALGDAQTVPRRIVGLKPREDGATDPTGSKDGLYRAALDVENETLMRALKGEEPVDATLRTAWDEKERTLREKLRRSLGPDYETSTAGTQALANFDRERAESFEAFNRQTVKDFSTITEARATSLSNLTGARLDQLTFPVNQEIGRGLALGSAANARDNFATVLAGVSPHTGASNASSASGGGSEAAIAALLGGLGKGLIASSGSIGNLGASGSTSPGVNGNSNVGPYAGTYATGNGTIASYL
jgi:hypothetical protein